MTDTSYSGRMLRVNLTSHELTNEILPARVLRTFIGGTGIGARILYDEVPPEVRWSDPENRLIMATGPLAGTRMGGSGTFSVVTKGCLTNGGTSTQANGFLGAFLRLNGYTGVIFEGISEEWVYLHVHDGQAELKDARHLVGFDVWATESAIKQELGETERSMSVYCIGPAGEHLVKFAAIIGDGGHAAAHNGCGAVMGSKRIKAIAVARGKGSVQVYDPDKVSLFARQIHESTVADPMLRMNYEWGTSMLFPPMLEKGELPCKNMTTNVLSEYEGFLGKNYRKEFEIKPKNCWACRMHHLHTVKVTTGPYAGYVAEEPDYECWAAFGPGIGQKDPGAAVMLSDLADRLGMDTNEAGWLMSFVIDCFERGIIGSPDTGGLEMRWGDAEAVRELLNKVARREGFGDVLAEGVKRAAEQIGGGALERAAYIKKGHAPRGHDHRARWTEELDYATSGTGTIETGPPRFGAFPELKLDQFTDSFSPDQVAYQVAKCKPKWQFTDCLGVCVFTIGPSLTRLVEIVNAATGWDITNDDVVTLTLRNVNLLRAFNIRHGIGPEVEAPSALYGSVPVDGPAKGKDIKEHWARMLDVYYQHMGWDRTSGKPLPETLKLLSLDDLVDDLWPEHKA